MGGKERIGGHQLKVKPGEAGAGRRQAERRDRDRPAQQRARTSGGPIPHLMDEEEDEKFASSRNSKDPGRPQFQPQGRKRSPGLPPVGGGLGQKSPPAGLRSPHVSTRGAHADVLLRWFSECGPCGQQLPHRLGTC